MLRIDNLKLPVGADEKALRAACERGPGGGQRRAPHGAEHPTRTVSQHGVALAAR